MARNHAYEYLRYSHGYYSYSYTQQYLQANVLVRVQALPAWLRLRLLLLVLRLSRCGHVGAVVVIVLALYVVVSWQASPLAST